MSGAAADWRRFLSGRYAAFGTLAVSDAIAVALAGDGLAIPLVATLGASPALATLIGLLPFLGGVLQALVPAVLRRNRGDLRGLTIVIASIGLMRPLLYLAVVASIWAGVLTPVGGILLIAIGFGVGATDERARLARGELSLLDQVEHALSKIHVRRTNDLAGQARRERVG